MVLRGQAANDGFKSLQRLAALGRGYLRFGSKFRAAPADAEQRVQQLTKRERQLIPLVCGGLKNKEIAQQLGIAESTVWHHLTAVFTKLKVEDRLGLAAFAFSHRPALTAGQSHPPRVQGW